MRFTRLLSIAAAAAVAGAAPGVASAGVASLDMRELSSSGERGLALAAPAGPFQMVGFHWQGSGALRYRVHRPGGWSAWSPVERTTRAGAPGGEMRSRPAWHVAEGVWVGRADRAEVRRVGTVGRVRVFTVRSPVSRVPLRRSVAAAGQPNVVPRSAWLANESIRRGSAAYAPAIRLAIVHHTAGSNTYTREQAPAIVRAIQLYHVQANGWNDIGYNALVDRYGTVYEGRHGGIERNVVGAHARGFNTGSFGIAVLGNFDLGTPTDESLEALARTIAWKLDQAHVDPRSALTASSAGNERFAPGVGVLLRAISGHRDPGATSCPGDALYARLPELAQRVQAIGLPKLYEPRIDGVLGGLIRVRARLSSPQPWSIAISDATGATAAQGAGTGIAVDWTWNSAGAPASGYRWRITAGSATPASGSIGTAVVVPEATLALTAASAVPAAISPNDDEHDDRATITYTLSSAANVSAVVLDAVGAPVAELERARWRRAGERTLSFDGLGLPDGAYTIRLVAKGAGGLEATSDVPVAVTRTLGGAAAAPAVITPNGDGRAERLAVSFALNAPAAVRVRVLREGTWVATAFSGELAAGLQVIRWDGRKRVGRARDGAYEAVVEATDALASTSIRLPFLSDATAPLIRLRSARAPVRLWASEPARLTVRVNGAMRRVEVRERGVFRLENIARIRTLVVVARDAAGNRSVLRHTPRRG